MINVNIEKINIEKEKENENEKEECLLINDYIEDLQIGNNNNDNNNNKKYNNNSYNNIIINKKEKEKEINLLTNNDIIKDINKDKDLIKDKDKATNNNKDLNKENNKYIDYKKYRNIINEFFKLISSIKNCSFDAIKKESIYYLSNLDIDITELSDNEKNTCNYYIYLFLFKL